MNVKIYIEGGGDSKLQHVQCREGFRKLFENAGFTGRMPRTIAGGGRGGTFDAFKTAIAVRSQDTMPMLLVDSEDPVTVPTAWEHLQARDKWERPADVTDDQAQLMVTCMETWIMADHLGRDRNPRHSRDTTSEILVAHLAATPSRRCACALTPPKTDLEAVDTRPNEGAREGEAEAGAITGLL